MDVTGPISSLPGANHAVPKGAMCDNHPDVPATHRVQGETDSFGSEMLDLCDECYSKINTSVSGFCRCCKKRVDKLYPKRDYEEGPSGPVYYMCKPCISAENKRELEELEEYEEDEYDWQQSSWRDWYR